MMTVAVLTKNRAAAFQRCAASIQSNANKYGRDIELVVADDSDELTAIQNRLALQNTGIKFRHYDRRFRNIFAEKLAKYAGVDPNIARFALLPDVATAMGASRNFLSLILVGKKFVSLDDDMVCKFAPFPGRRNEILHLKSERLEPQPVWAIDGVSEQLLQDEDFVSHHTNLLNDEVALTIGGSIGDSGMGNTYSMLFNPEFLKQCISLEGLNAALTRRAILRSTAQPQILDWPDCTGMSLGLNAELNLPPFIPILRGEDTLFGLMLRNCAPHKKSAYCNYAMWHTPIRKSKLSHDLAFVGVPEFNDILVQLLVWVNPQTLQEFGSMLMDLSSAEYLHNVIENLVAAWRIKILKKLEKLEEGLPDFLIQELRRVGEIIMGLPAASAPADLPCNEFEVNLRQVASLFLEWPALFEAARNYVG